MVDVAIGDVVAVDEVDEVGVVVVDVVVEPWRIRRSVVVDEVVGVGVVEVGDTPCRACRTRERAGMKARVGVAKTGRAKTGTIMSHASQSWRDQQRNSP